MRANTATAPATARPMGLCGLPASLEATCNGAEVVLFATTIGVLVVTVLKAGTTTEVVGVTLETTVYGTVVATVPWLVTETVTG